MVNIVQPQFNLHSEEANVSKLSLHFSKFYFKIVFGVLTIVSLFIPYISLCFF
jgi:hypothetical protein